MGELIEWFEVFTWNFSVLVDSVFQINKPLLAYKGFDSLHTYRISLKFGFDKWSKKSKHASNRADGEKISLTDGQVISKTVNG